MPRDLTQSRLLMRAPQLLHLDGGGRDSRALYKSECGHDRDPHAGYYQPCAPCAAIPHPRTNPDALTAARKGKAKGAAA